MLRLVMAALAACVLALPASAQAPAQVDQTAAMAAARKMVADAKAEAVFVPGAWEAGPAVQHALSGMICRFFSDPRDTVHVFEHPGATRGIDVSCGLWVGGVFQTIYATPAAALGGFDVAASDADQQLKASGSFTAIDDYKGAAAGGLSGPSKSVLKRYTAEFQGRRVFTRLALIDMGDWVIKQRLTAPVEMAAHADELADAVFNAVAEDMRGALAARPPPATSPASP